ncbi:MAG: 7-carboxy-7-deazaguanine synthase [Saprospiraceae bacterium]
MGYQIKEIFYTLQGEGAMAGRPAVFCRFTGCNLWSGREEDRAQAICTFCDTDFRGTDGLNGGTYPDAEHLAMKIASCWPDLSKGTPYVVCTGGEPLLQMDVAFTQAIKKYGFEIAVETNGTKPLVDGIDWVCVSPKSTANLAVTEGNELKLVYPQMDADPKQFEKLSFDHFYLQPMDGENAKITEQQTLEYCLKNPQWKMSVQVHKWLNIP